VTGAQTVVGEVAGPGVQIYSEDRMMEDCIRAFNLSFKKRFWEQYTYWLTATLDGVTGKVTDTTLKNVRDLEDVQYIRIGGTDNEIPLLPGRINPNALAEGSDIRFFGSLPVTDPEFNTKRLKFYPLMCTGTVDIRARVYPVDRQAEGLEWDWDDEMHLDKDMLVYGTAYFTLGNDDINANAADLARNMMEARYRDIMAALSSQDIIISSGSNIPNQWSVCC